MLDIHLFNVKKMLEGSGKFMVYASNVPSPKRLKIVGSAVTKVADSLNLETEFSPRKRLLSIYVYYKNNMNNEIPVYCDWGKNWREEDVYRAIRNMMFVLSFHPHHSNLRTIRKEVIISA